MNEKVIALDSGDDWLRTIKKNQCSQCMHGFEGGKTCEAFPKGIPEDILIDKVKHTKPYKGDQGIRFKSWKEEANWFRKLQTLKRTKKEKDNAKKGYRGARI